MGFSNHNTNGKHNIRRPRRLVLYAIDIANITGLSERSARRLLQSVKVALSKNAHEFVTVREFAAVYGVDEDFIFEHME